jgi:hypothetical protein
VAEIELDRSLAEMEIKNQEAENERKRLMVNCLEVIDLAKKEKMAEVDA